MHYPALPSAPSASYISSQPTTHQANPELERLGRIEDLIRDKKISFCTAQELVDLSKFDIAFICDDSGSMTLPAKEPVKGSSSIAYISPTRWDQLKGMVGLFTEIVTAVDRNGTDIHFLNRPSLLNIESKDDMRIAQAFDKRPQGRTPLRQKLLDVVQNHQDDKSLLLLIATDGIPTTDTGQPDPQGFKTALREVTNGDHTQSREVYVSMLACTDNPGEISWLNRLDREVKNVDVNRTYLEERKEVLAKNPGIEFNQADYVAKALLPKFDKLDEQNMSGNQASCCTIS